MFNKLKKDEFLNKLIAKPTEKAFILDYKCLNHSYKDITFNKGLDADTINLWGREGTTGIGIHIPGEIEIYLNKKYERMTCFVGQEKNAILEVNPRKFMDYQVLLDGKEVWSGGGKVDFHSVDINVSGADVLTLICGTTHGLACGHVAWQDLTLYGTEGDIVRVGDCFCKNKPPFSFKYNGVSSDDFLYKWDYSYKKEIKKYSVNINNPHCPVTNDITTHTVKYKDPESPLSVIMEVLDYDKDATLWYNMWFENVGEERTGQISDIKVCDNYFEGLKNPTVHVSKGSDFILNDFEPITKTLENSQEINLWTEGGRPTNYHMPYFNIEGEDESLVGAMGWSGSWKGNIKKINVNTMRVSFGLDDYMDFYLEPGEKVQVPSMCLTFSKGEFEENQNDFRKFMVDYIIPRDDKGDIRLAPICVMGWGGMRDEEYEKRIKAIKDHKFPYEYYWMDAGWYGPADSYSPNGNVGDWSIHVGDWQVNPKAHPKGLRYLSDKFAEIGLKFLLWVEPERAIYGTPVTLEYPDIWLGEKFEKEGLLLNMSKDEACDWAIDFVSHIIEKYNVKCFREDYNFDPLGYWKENDEKNRHGITEIRAVNNGYRFWKTLLEKYPDLIIDNCASGGRKLDINMARLSFALWRTDYQCFYDHDPLGAQLVQNRLPLWNINNSTGTQHFPGDTFRARACMACGYLLDFCNIEEFALTEDYPFDWHRRMLEDFKRIREYFYGNYYSILPAKYDYSIWISYEMYREDMDEGCLFVFRERDSKWTAAKLNLKGINPDKTYIVEDLDDNSTFEMKGCDLLDEGFDVLIPNKLQSKLYIFKMHNAQCTMQN